MVDIARPLELNTTECADFVVLSYGVRFFLARRSQNLLALHVELAHHLLKAATFLVFVIHIPDICNSYIMSLILQLNRLLALDLVVQGTFLLRERILLGSTA